MTDVLTDEEDCELSRLQHQRKVLQRVDRTMSSASQGLELRRPANTRSVLHFVHSNEV